MGATFIKSWSNLLLMGSSKKKDVVQIEIPKKLAEKAENMAKVFGYVSLTEFTRDAIRRRLEELEKVELEAEAK